MTAVQHPSYQSYQPHGLHVLADLFDVAAERLSSAETVDHLLRRAAEAADATILHAHFHAFGPGQGITGVLLLAESHISIHTWPESGFAAVDIFMCGNAAPQKALDVIVAALQPARTATQTVARGEA
ncbi:MAG: adenosylmethionine decarboxylase [Proteobacteria bacterium]|nr:adenosylmethionine decarboxylase [Pseudomonadota bacterium]